MSVASYGCDADFAGMAAVHCSRCHLSFADRPGLRRASDVVARICAIGALGRRKTTAAIALGIKIATCPA
jgi:hypothetical protein